MVVYAGLLIFFFLEYTRPHDVFPFIIALKLYSLLPLLLFFVSNFRETAISSEAVWKSKQAIVLIVFLLLILLAIPFGWNRMMASEMFVVVLGYFFVFYLVARNVDSIERMKGLFLMLIAIHLYLIVRNPDIILSPDVRDYIKQVAFLGDGNDFALSVVIVLPMCLFLYSTSRSKILKIAMLAIGGLLLFSIMGSQSRGATLALGAFGFYLWTQSKRKAVGVLVIGVVVGFVLVFASDVYLGRLATISQYEQEGSAMGRINAWKAGIWMANQNPLFGVGAGGFQVGHAVYYGGEYKAAHSMYFHVLGEYGYLGLVLLLAFLVSAFRSNQRLIRDIDTGGGKGSHLVERSLLLYMNASLVGFAVAAAFLSVFYYPHLYVVGGLSLATNQIVSGRISATRNSGAGPGSDRSEPPRSKSARRVPVHP